MASNPFTIHNLPFGIISTDAEPIPRCAVAFENSALELSKHFKTKKLEGVPRDFDLATIFGETTLNSFAELPPTVRKVVRNHLIRALSDGSVSQSCFVPLVDVKYHLPMKIGGYVDFFCSLEHARNCASLTGGDVAPNFYSSPLCYNGRVSSVVSSPTPIHRPKGISYDTGVATGNKAIYGPSRKMDFELEIGYFVAKPVSHGNTLTIDEARDYIFGFVLLNDWSSRDIQAFEMRPLGPFHSKGFGTSISPWVVTLDALEPFAASSLHHHEADTFEHLRWKEHGIATFDLKLQATLIRNQRRTVVAVSNLRNLYWSPFQQLTHLAAAGCGISSGDLLGTGTVSGKMKGSFGSLFEATSDGNETVPLTDGDSLGYLLDYDEIVLEAWASTADGKVMIGLGECRGQLLPAM